MVGFIGKTYQRKLLKSILKGVRSSNLAYSSFIGSEITKALFENRSNRKVRRKDQNSEA